MNTRIFVKINGDLETAIAKIYDALGAANYMVGNSLNVPGGLYGTFSIFGIRIVIHENDYDYEDEYGYVLFIEKDVLSTIWTVEQYEKAIVEIVCGLIYHNLKTKVAMDVGDELLVYKPSDNKN